MVSILIKFHHSIAKFTCQVYLTLSYTLEKKGPNFFNYLYNFGGKLNGVQVVPNKMQEIVGIGIMIVSDLHLG